MKKYGFIKTFLILFLSLLFIEVIFKLILFKSILDFSMIRILLFNVSTTLLLSFLIMFLRSTFIKILIGVFLFSFALYPYLQIGFYSIMGNFLSFNAAGDGALRVTEYIVVFFKGIKIEAYLLFLPLIIYIILMKKYHITFEKKKNMLYDALIILLILLVHVVSILTLELSPKSQIVNNKKLYESPTLINISLNQFGSNRFMIRDVVTLISSSNDEFEVIEREEEEEEKTDYSRIIDDTEWEAMIEAETDPKIKSLHQFFINRHITPKNEYTGMFKDKNLVLIMIESFDFMAINEELTPTLYRLKEEGWFFDNYYTPRYSCATGASELIGLTSMIPSSTLCTPNVYPRNNYDTSMFNLFKAKDYRSTSYHNWSDQYYERTILHNSLGSEKFYKHSDLKISSLYGWPSDLDLFKKAMPYFIDEERYFSFIISSTMHFPYDRQDTVVAQSWDLVKNLDVPSKVKNYIAKSIDFDKGVKYLLDTLEEKGTLDDTVIVLFADHYPYNMQLDYIKEYSGIDRTTNMNMERSPFIIYNSASEKKVISKTASTFDILPTLANLFDLDYDPRYYMGKDLFSNEETTIAFTNGSWITDRAMYFAAEGRHLKLTDVSDAYLLDTNERVNESMNAFRSAFTNNYFKYRFKK
jgi:lipoteichoic acid synthase